MSIGASTRLRKAREHQGLTIAALAEKTRLNPIEIANLEAGNDLQLLSWQVVKVIRLAVALDIPLSTLLGEEKEILSYTEWALVLAALVEYSANKPGLRMDAHIWDLIEKVRQVADPSAPALK